MKRLLLFVVFMTTATLSFYFLVVPEEKTMTENGGVMEEARNDSNLLLQGVLIQHMEGKRLAWEVRAQSADFDEPRKQARLRIVNMNIMAREKEGDQEGSPSMMAQSREAQVQGDSGRVLLLGAVRLTGGEELEIRGERVEYDHKRGLVRIPGAAVIRYRDQMQEGEDLRFSIPDQLLEFRNSRMYR